MADLTKIPLHWVYGITAFVFLLAKVMDGFLRWFFGLAGLGPLVYVPVAASLGIIVLHGIVVLSRFRGPLFATVCGVLFVIFAGLGLFFLGVPKQVAFGIYVFSPILFGAIAYRGFFVERHSWLVPFAILVTALTLSGALLDMKFNLPWAGFSFEVGGEEVSGTRAWTTHGLERIAGFSRASYSLAKQSIIAALLYEAFGTNPWLKFGIWIISGGVVALSTTKGVLVAWLCISLYFMGRKILPRWMIMALPLLSVLCGILLPALSYFVDFSPYFDNNLILKIALGSFRSRLVITWPLAIQMVQDHGSLILGRGLGGIGTAQVGRELFYSPGDNMYVYFFGIMGLFSLFIYVPWLWTINKLKPYSNSDDHFIFLISLLVFIYGITTGVVEDPFIGFFLGLSLAHLFLPKPDHADKT